MREGTKYMVTNTLEIYASSEAIKALITLQIIRSERVGDLDTMPVKVVIAEVITFFVSFVSFDRAENILRNNIVLVSEYLLMGFITDLRAVEILLYFHKCAKRRVRQVLHRS